MQGRVLSRARLTQVCTVLHPGDLTPKPGSIYWVFRPRFLGLVCHKWPHVCALNCRNRPNLTCVKILSGIRHCYAYGHILISNARKPFLHETRQRVEIKNMLFFQGRLAGGPSIPLPSSDLKERRSWEGFETYFGNDFIFSFSCFNFKFMKVRVGDDVIFVSVATERWFNKILGFRFYRILRQ